MAWQRESLSTLVNRAESGSTAPLNITSPVLRRAIVRVFSRIVGGAAHMLHGHIAWMVDQIFPDRAEMESVKREASLYGESPNEPEYASGLIVVTGTDSTIVPNGTSWFLGTREYETQGDHTIGASVSGEVAVLVEAVTAGLDGNAEAGASISLGSPIVGVDSIATVGDDGIAGGTEEESPEDFTRRFLELLRAEELGGSDDDYIKWAKEVPGVTRAWVYRHENGRGTVVVRFVRDGDPSLIPDSGEVAAVQAKFDAERPTTAEVTAVAPAGIPRNYTISISPDTAANRTAIQKELTDLHFRRGRPGDGVSKGKILLAEMRTAIGVVVDDYELVSPTEDYLPGLGEMAIDGAITWA